MARYQCNYCAFVYDEALGLPDEGFPPGTRFEDLPDDWFCPQCGAERSDYEGIEE